MDQVELEIYRVHGLTDKTDNRGSFWIKFDLGYSKDDKIGVFMCVYGLFVAYIAGYFERYILRGAESSGIALCFPLLLLSPLSLPSDCSCLAVVISSVDSPVVVVVVVVVIVVIVFFIQSRPSSLPETGTQRGKNHEKDLSLNRKPPCQDALFEFLSFVCLPSEHEETIRRYPAAIRILLVRVHAHVHVPMSHL